MKIALICSRGGHLTQILMLLKAFDRYDIFIVSNNSPRDEELQANYHTYLRPTIGVRPLELLKSTGWAYKIIKTENPDVIFSTGSEIAIPFIILGKILKKKTIYLESWSRIYSLSHTGKLIYPLVDEFWVQWPELLNDCGNKAKYMGAVL